MPTFPRYVLTAGPLVAGLDIVLAMGFWWLRAGVPPTRILQSVAAGVLGDRAFASGAGTAALGAFLHVFIACGMAAVYWIVASRAPALRRQWVPAGIAYGLLLYVAMTYVVVPLSLATAGPFSWPWFLASVFAHVVLVGLPLAWLARLRR